MRFHIISLPHTQTTKDYCWCAYTAKVLKFCNMMTDIDHEVYLYGGIENEARVKEFIPLVPGSDLQKWFGHYDYNKHVFGDWDRNSECWQTMNSRAVLEISRRKQPGDILGLIGGLCQEQIKMGLPDMRCVEWGIGYEGIIDDAFHVFESNPWMHYVYGMRGIKDGRFFDTVIENSFEEEDFIFKDKKEDYLLYLGRLTPRKGMEVVRELAARGHKIKMAGQGEERIPGTEYVGVVRGKEKAELLANAKALLVPTFYIEPFGGVAIEAMLSGTPVITTDFGAFTETIIDKVNGYRCHTMKDFEDATEGVGVLSPRDIRYFSEKYLTKNVKHKYDKYFNRLSLLDGAGWYAQ